MKSRRKKRVQPASFCHGATEKNKKKIVERDLFVMPCQTAPKRRKIVSTGTSPKTQFNAVRAPRWRNQDKYKWILVGNGAEVPINGSIWGIRTLFDFSGWVRGGGVVVWWWAGMIDIRRFLHQSIPESFKAFCKMVSLTAAKTSRMFEVSVACVRLRRGWFVS